MMGCTDCGIAYLSPRPGREYIKNAYSDYYTHTSDKDDLVHNYLRSIKNYLSEKYYAVISKSGGYLDYVIYVMLRVLFPISLYLDAKSRHIFKAKNMPGKLLDIGCGNGEYLRFASRFGWSVVGVDFDGKAVSEARSGGLDVRLGSVDVIDSNEKFDFITLSHVIEHVYNPAELIRTCYSLLSEGGTLWLETPNIESMGYALYKSNWRGLEPPRHVMLFNQASLSEILLKSGFVSVEQKIHGLSGVYMGSSSEKLLNKSSPCGSLTGCIVRKVAKLLRVTFLELTQLFCKRRREFLTLVAIR
ncbi:MAG: class I SAM-dependent methyltransferase [Gammaproteobacteria bacterium]|nr:class I SAM-dependent methyltransferase [Gammaproteobacteria bacterium]